MNIHCKIKLEPGAKLPTRAHDTDTGYDAYAHKITYITTFGRVWERTETGVLIDGCEVSLEDIDTCEIDHIVIDTGVSICPPQGYACIAAAQSRLAKSGMVIAYGIGVIDNGYRGTIKFVYSTYTGTAKIDMFAIGKKCGQLIFHKVETADFEEVDELPETDRGTGGFGSTGNS